MSWATDKDTVKDTDKDTDRDTGTRVGGGGALDVPVEEFDAREPVNGKSEDDVRVPDWIANPGEDLEVVFSGTLEGWRTVEQLQYDHQVEPRGTC